ncbi:MAG: transglycosylase domain-containing protein [Bacteriovoracaceae bacterium]|nr:transglycosylase domain-containing protein [Bacteriovoracaceae bacterium]
MTNNQSQPGQSPGQNGKKVNKFLKYGIFSVLSLIGLGVFCLCVVLVYIWHLTQTLPSVTKLREYNPAVPSYIYDREGKILLRLGIENRDLVELKNTPKIIVDAVLSAEDGRFFEHQGIDFTGIFRAMLMNIKAGRVVQGGSTFTQQVAKSLLLSSEKTIERKIKDFLLAISIEQKFTKEEILFFYLNQVYLGRGCYGFKAAAKGYFDKEFQDLNLAEAAMLAGLLVAPTKYSPFNNPDHAKSRQSYVLSRMFEEGRISKKEYETALTTKLKLRRNQEGSGVVAGYFTEWIRQRLIDKIGEEELLSGGYQVHTTLDLELQNVAEQEVKKGSREIDRRQGYKGALGHIENSNYVNQEIELRQRLLKDSSTYTYLLTTGDLQDEFEISKEDLVILQEQLSKNFEKSKSESISHKMSLWMSQELNNEILLSKLDPKVLHDAMVVGVNDEWKVVFVTLGGLYGVIPLEGFQWAKKRSFSAETVLGGLVDHPTKILKMGDIVKVSVAEGGLKPLNTFIAHNNVINNKLKDSFFSDYVKNTKFIKCLLEQEPEVQSALLSLDVNSGEVLALVGGNDFSFTKFNRVIQAKRQAGSAVKPIVYAAALELGYTPNSTLLDSPQSLSSTDAILSWKPKNYDGEFKGLITLRKSLEESRNVSTVNLLQQIGIKKVSEFMSRFNKDIQIPADLSIALGSFGISLLDLTSIYQVFPNYGKRTPISMVTMIKDKHQRPLDVKTFSFLPTKKENNLSENNSKDTEVKLAEENSKDLTKDLDSKEEIEEAETDASVEAEVGDKKSNSERGKINSTEQEFMENLANDQIYDPRLAYIMTNLLKGVIQNGTATNARDLGDNIAGKTGTTSEYVDAWFVGYTSNTVTGVWSGFDTNSTMGFGETGNQAALPTWKNFMAKAIAKRGNKPFLIPSGVISKPVSRVSGLISSPKDPTAYSEYFVEGYLGDSRLNMLQASPGENTLIDRDNYFDQQ